MKWKFKYTVKIANTKWVGVWWRGKIDSTRSTMGNMEWRGGCRKIHGRESRFVNKVVAQQNVQYETCLNYILVLTSAFRTLTFSWLQCWFDMRIKRPLIVGREQGRGFLWICWKSFQVVVLGTPSNLAGSQWEKETKTLRASRLRANFFFRIKLQDYHNMTFVFQKVNFCSLRLWVGKTILSMKIPMFY